jgi:GT2 family glycosyltransferase
MVRPISIIVVTWNGASIVRQCLESLRNITDHPEYEIVVSDNGSTDGTLDYVKSLPGVRVIENCQNLGFVRGNNAAMRTVAANRDVVLLNSDTEIIQPEWLCRMQATAYSEPAIGLVGCRLWWPNGTLQHAGSYMPSMSLWGQYIGSGEKDINQFNRDREVDSVIFACAYIKRSLIDAIGHLDEDYFSYYEDSDYCLKAQRAGFKVFCCGQADLIHLEQTSTRINNVSQPAMHAESRKVFRRKWQAHFQQARFKQNLAWRSTIGFPTGYSRSSRALLKALNQRDVRVAYQNLYNSDPGSPNVEPPLWEHDEIAHLPVQRIDPRMPQVVYGTGDLFHRNTGATRIGFSMLETDGLPAEWVKQANRMDEVWVPSRFNVDTFANSGVRRPIHVMPLGIDPNYFNPDIRGWKDPHQFNFLSVFEWGERKAPEILLKAFNDEFGQHEDVGLICKVMNQDGAVDVAAEIARLNLRPDGGRVAFSLNHIVADNQLGALYRSADCLVHCSRGEGFGMPVLEAMACGLPVIATRWSSMVDFVNDGNAYPLDVEKLVPARAKCPYYKGFRWAQPSYEHLRELMRFVFENPADAADRGRIAADNALRNWTWGHAADKIIARLDAIGDSGTGR